jgi:hypothetical protein
VPVLSRHVAVYLLCQATSLTLVRSERSERRKFLGVDMKSPALGGADRG